MAIFKLVIKFPIDYAAGDLICKDCGLVLGDRIVDEYLFIINFMGRFNIPSYYSYVLFITSLHKSPVLCFRTPKKNKQDNTIHYLMKTGIQSGEPFQTVILQVQTRTVLEVLQIHCSVIVVFLLSLERVTPLLPV